MGTTPRYREIADELKEAIVCEQQLVDVQLTGGAKMPTEPELAEHFQVSRGTIRQAISELAAEGLIETKGRAGTFVRRLRMLEHSAHSEHPDRKGTADSWFAEVKRSGRTPSQDFSFRIVPATPAVAKRLRIQPDDLVVVRDCFRYVDELPWSTQTSYYPFDVAQAANIATPQDVEEGTVRRLAAHGFREVGWADEVSCRPATADEVRAFDLARGVSVIVYSRVGWTDERPVRLTREVLPADRNVVLYESGDLSAKHTAEAADAASAQVGELAEVCQ